MIKEIEFKAQTIDSQNIRIVDHFIPLNPNALAFLSELDFEDFTALRGMNDMDLLGCDIARPCSIVHLKEVMSDTTNTLNEILCHVKADNKLVRYHWCAPGFTATLLQS